MTRTKILLVALTLIIFGTATLKADTAEIVLLAETEERLVENAASCMAVLEANTNYGIVPKVHSSVRSVNDILLEVADVVFDGDREALENHPLYEWQMEQKRRDFAYLTGSFAEIFIKDRIRSCRELHAMWMYSATGRECHLYSRC